MVVEQKALNLQNVPEYSVSQLSNHVRRTLEDSFGHVKIRGEISGYRGRHSSGHCYFALKDERARIDAVVWRGVFSKLKFKPEEGMEVIVTGKVSSYPGSSKYQIVIESMEPAGVGALMALLEERKKKFTEEGLFAQERKKQIPFLPQTIGIITSPTGAVIQDMMHGFEERFPAHIILWPVRVQGDTCANEVARALAGFNAIKPGGAVSKPDLIIVARGGGSLEDLWGFNEEAVVRAVANSEIPIISAVGHETDWTLIDLAADARAPTPTKAAEWAVPKYSELIERGKDLELRLQRTIQRYIAEQRSKTTGLGRAMPRLQDLIAMPRQRLDSIPERMENALKLRIQSSRSRITEMSSRLAPGLRENAHTKRTYYLSLKGRFIPSLSKSLVKRRLAFQNISSRYAPTLLRQKISYYQQRLSAIEKQAYTNTAHKLAVSRSKFESCGKLLSSLGYQNVLKRGYVLARDENGSMVRTVDGVKTGQKLALEFFDGFVETTASDITGKSGQPEPKAKNDAKTAKPKKRKPDDTDQGSLF